MVFARDKKAHKHKHFDRIVGDWAGVEKQFLHLSGLMPCVEDEKHIIYQGRKKHGNEKIMVMFGAKFG